MLTNVTETKSDNTAICDFTEITAINAEHGVSLVQHRVTGKIYIRKILTVYNTSVYISLQHHPIMGTPRIIALHEDHNQLTVIEEYISGTALNELMDAHALTVPKIKSYLTDLCNILEQLHTRKPPIIHRDIKPSNLIITPYDRLVILDFNAAKWYTPEDNADTVLLGTQGFAAPEQYGFGCSTPQTDLYAVGILIKKLVKSLPEPTAEFDPIIDKCTRLDPKQRYQSVSELKNALDGTLDHRTAKSNPSSAHKYTLPGYRTKTPYKMVLATIAYLTIIWLCATIQIGEAAGAQLWFERFISFAMILSIIFSCCNYRDIRRLIPLCGSRYRLIRYIGVTLLIIMLIFALSFFMVLVEDIFFPTGTV